MMPVTVYLSQPAVAQGLPSTVRGDIGLQAGTLPPPGIYVVNLIYNYNFDTLRTNDGGRSKGQAASITHHMAWDLPTSRRRNSSGEITAPHSSCPLSVS